MKVLNLYAGIGGNRKLWQGVDVTSVELQPHIAKVYRDLYPDDELIETDAHEYLKDNYFKYDFIWSSPPCPTHSRLNDALPEERKRFPEMELYQEIIFLKHYFAGNWVVENVIPYYVPLIAPSVTLGRHLFWSNFHIPSEKFKPNPNISLSTVEELSDYHEIKLPADAKDQRKMLRNAVNPLLGLHVFNAAPRQEELF